jgi:cephalosporin-C deacetylase-like acetyl esterase
MAINKTALCFCLAGVCCYAQSGGGLDFLTGQVDGRDLREMLPRYLKHQVQMRKQSRTGTATDFRARFTEMLGGLPERTPLNARTVGVVQRDGYRIEKVIFESQPGFHVTANLYLPVTGSAPYPAILFPLGHEAGGKAYPVWQQILGTFARQGYVALTWDPLGQGERVQLYDEAFQGSKVGPSTTEHTVQGIQCLLVGDALARYTVWDGIRALDYLTSRPEVDAKRIGCTGNSGGGTHTAYLSALDDRIRVAAPSCFLTKWERLLDTIGPQDAEQCIPGFLAAGYEHADFVRAFAPKPYLMLSAIRDFFSIAGARATFAEARGAYTGAEEKLAMAEADEGHGYSKTLRQAAYPWFARWLDAGPAPAEERIVVPAQEQELWCTKTGQIATSLGGKTVFSLNRERARAVAPREKPTRETVRQLIQWQKTEGAPTVQGYGSEQRDGLLVEKVVYETDPGIRVPAVIVSRPGVGGERPAVLLASARGKSAAWSEVQALSAKGAVVMAVDLRGLGETRASGKGGDWPSWFGDYDSTMTAVLLARSLPAMRALDIQRGFEVLAARPDVDRKRIYGAGQGSAAVALLHAAAAGTGFTRVLVDGMLASYRSVIEAPIHRGVFESIVPGALRHYDLPDLAAIAGTPMLVVDASTPLGAVLALEDARSAFASAANVRVVRRLPEEPAAQVYTRILE